MKERTAVFVSTFSCVVMAAAHIWTVVLAFQVNGFGSYGWLIAVISLCAPFLSEAVWGFWALVHGHPFLWGSIAFFVFGYLASRATKEDPP